MPSVRGESEYGPHSFDYGLSYEPDPWAAPEPVDDPDAWESDVNDAPIEAGWEKAFRDGTSPASSSSSAAALGTRPVRPPNRRLLSCLLCGPPSPSCAPN